MVKCAFKNQPHYLRFSCRRFTFQSLLRPSVFISFRSFKLVKRLHLLRLITSDSRWMEKVTACGADVSVACFMLLVFNSRVPADDSNAPCLIPKTPRVLLMRLIAALFRPPRILRWWWWECLYDYKQASL